MKPLTLYLLIGFSCVSACFSLPRTAPKAPVTLPATALKPYGRFWINKEMQLELISSAAHFGFRFEGRECKVFASLPGGQDHNYLQYALDGVYQKRLKVGKTTTPLVITAANAGKHTVWIYKATEAHTGPIAIEKILGENLHTLPNPTAPLLEFIGNSITCGAASDASEVPCGTGQYHDQHNAYQAYGPRVARALNANFLLSSVSGIGIYRNWNSDAPTMPQVYENIDFQPNTPYHWNFATYSPAVVSLALGTNDLSNGDGKTPRLPFDSARYVSTYVQFIKLVKTKYPRARIALLSSPMITGRNRTLLQNCLTVVKQKTDANYPADQPVATYFFQPMQPRGCTNHPSVEDHALLAKELVPFFKKLL
ncbi:SGNH/GDSL hydrolase family protein [Hymenobacter sp. BT18]|uniref:SGNH/GDSL hydrolase family protein n=1 Tax=Hymenobacter sp. BT18 TaxID=2835648 RepID=UPI00143E31A7|nr:SGNH/GDSL hydrolase family protein [Hymenobacter sp. BT18]QIX60119.1 SGNH/GDSL hydrolase family protein [Hymenobacter sp. BT18]